ncbi:MAG: SDR family NAD(P)-dependent oxidoreductase [Pseudomonadales bacterium]|jgi:meso-butanediol dehydrogenase/(S,S)-butanediol dehydrogenase/diacetyl reductase
MNLEGQVALVTAAGRGIGRGIAESLAEAGASLVINSYSEATVRETAALCEAKGAQVEICTGDITDRDKMIEMREQALSTFGQIDILVNNVGAGPKSAIEPDAHELGPSQAIWDALYRQNLLPVVLMSEAVIPHMKAQRRGKIVHISSIAGKVPFSDKMLEYFVHHSYGAMKAALISFTQTQSELLGPFNINVNSVCPGVIYTDSWKQNSERAVTMIDEFKGQDPREWFEGIARGDYPHIFDRTPLRREQTVEDIGRAVVFLTSDHSVNITGQSLMVDGGMVKV